MNSIIDLYFGSIYESGLDFWSLFFWRRSIRYSFECFYKLSWNNVEEKIICFCGDNVTTNFDGAQHCFCKSTMFLLILENYGAETYYTWLWYTYIIHYGIWTGWDVLLIQNKQLTEFIKSKTYMFICMHLYIYVYVYIIHTNIYIQKS